MNSRLLYSAALSIFVACSSGCTTGFRNGQACKQKMIETYPTGSPELSYELPQASIHGRRVVVEATYQGPLKKPETGIFARKTADYPAAVECTFNGENMETFRWLSPKKLATAYANPDEKESDNKVEDQ